MIKKIFKSTIFKIVLVIAVAVGGFGVYKVIKAKKAVAAADTFSFTRTVTLAKGNLDETVTATGKIASSKVSTVTTSLKYEVKEIYVQVGDSVKAGDSIVQLDTSEIDKEISRAQSSSSDSLESLQDSYNSAVESKDAVWAQFHAAETALDDANTTLEAAQTKMAAVKKEVDTYQEVYNEATKVLAAATDAANTAYDEWLNASEEEEEEKKAAFDEAEAAMDAAKEVADAAEMDLMNAKDNTCYSYYEQNLSTAQSAYDKANSTYSTYKDQINSANAKVDEAKKKLDEGVSSDTLEDLYENKEKCTLKAKTDGVVTSLNATVGSTVTEATVATIQNTGSLQLSLTLDEYDIQKVETGMKAIVKSDALDKEFDAVVSQIDPVASTSQNSSGFGVTVTITSDDITGLKIGMSAEVDIIISSTEDVYSVPIDAIETEEDGTTVIYVQNDAGEFDPVEVTVGEETDYYAEISGSNLKEGMVVRASANEDEASVEIDASDAVNAFGDMGGGGMPSGGDMPSGGNMPSGGGFGGN